MSLLASKETFEGGEAAWYDPPYHRYDFFAVRAAALGKMLGDKRLRVLIVGCGYGYLVDDLVVLGYNAHGLDASEYAITKGRAVVPSVADRLHVGNALTWTQGRWSMIVTEDLLPCLEDSEIDALLPELRQHTNRLVHILSPFDDGGEPHETLGLNWKTKAEWVATVSPDAVYGPYMQPLKTES